MPTDALRQVVEHLRAATRVPGAELTDGQLLASFAAHRDEAAFADLLRRHGRMVWAVCRRILTDPQDAEDAFQGAFFALARKAASLSRCESVGGWLYRVAARAAGHVRTANARRLARERPTGHLPEVATGPAEPQDWREVLHQEVGRLPEVYREALVLCELEGLGRKEAARRLGVPEGTVSSRLAAAKRLLGERLLRRGLALSGGCAAVLAADVPAALAAATVRGAVGFVSGQCGATTAAAITKGVLRAMFISKFKGLVAATALVAVLGVGVFTCGATGRGPAQVASGAPPQARDAGGDAAPPEVKDPDADAEKALRRAREEAEALRQENERLLRELRKAKDEQAVLLKRLEQSVRDPKVADADAERERRLRDALRALDMALVQLDATKARAEELAAELQAERKARREAEDQLARLRVGDPAAEAEAALKAFREAQDKEAKQKALWRLQQALDKLKEGVK
jgi:RNA polymerase sigma factor (sigma-70 family)